MCLHLLTCGFACVAAYLQVENAAFDREAACVVPGVRGGSFFPISSSWQSFRIGNDYLHRALVEVSHIPALRS